MHRVHHLRRYLVQVLFSLQYLSDEYKKSWQKIFEEKNIDPIDRIIRIIQNDFSSKIANRNKISVWIAFYSEVKFRPSYLTICQRQDEIYSQQMEKLVSRLIEIKEDIKSNGSRTQVLDKLRSLIKDVEILIFGETVSVYQDVIKETGFTAINNIGELRLALDRLKVLTEFKPVILHAQPEQDS